MTTDRSDSGPPAHVALVGCGVRGAQTLWRLVSLWRQDPPKREVVVHVTDPFEPGPGRTWRIDQSQLLLMNGPMLGTTAFRDGEGPSLSQWAAELVSGSDSEIAEYAAEAPEWVIRYANSHDGSAYCPRPFYGHYLRWFYRYVLARVPESVSVLWHQEQVVSAETGEDRATGARLRLNSSARQGPNSGALLRLASGEIIDADAVVLSLGWLPAKTDQPRDSSHWIGPGHPPEQDLDRIPARARVLVRGMGMSFFDAFAQLTEGRGGRFEPDGAKGRLRYLPSGDEPELIIGSRRGVPYRSKPPVGMPAAFPHAFVEALARRERPLDFTADIMPAIEQDATIAYYTVLAEVRPSSIRSGQGLLKRLRAAPRARWQEIIAEEVPNPGERLDLRRVQNPGLGLVFDSASQADAWVARNISEDLQQAYLAERSPIKAAMRSIGDARRTIARLVRFSGITGASFPAYRTFTSWGAMMGGGPPALRNEQLLAVRRAGLVTLTGPGLAIHESESGWVGESASTPTARWHADYLLDAWMHGANVEKTVDPLLRSVTDHGLGRAHIVDGVASGALEVEPVASGLVAQSGEVTPGMYALGIPCEGQRIFTILSPRPGSEGSVIDECAATAASVVATLAG